MRTLPGGGEILRPPQLVGRRGPRALVAALAAAGRRAGPEARRAKLEILGLLTTRRVADARTLRALHETLCYLRAYPDDADVLAAVDRSLDGIPGRVRRLPAAQRRRLRDSGIAGSTLAYPFGLPMARWLAARFPRDVDVAWRGFAGAEALQEALAVLVEPVEQDGASEEGGLGWRRWLAAARGGRRRTDLEVLLEVFDRARADGPTRDLLFEDLALPLRWQLRDRSASRTFARLPWPQPFFRAAGGETSRRPTPPELIRFATRPLPGLRPAPRALAGRLIEAARLAMATRLRELFAFSHANPADVMIADPGRGLRIALIGIRPELRLPLEGYYAYLALRNGVPIGYGAGWQFLGTLELAVNVFDPYRGGESALVLGEVLRAYHQAFGMRAVRVDPYQIGHGNPEALAAGAFYFYYHLGFRPEDPQTRRRAQREQRIVARRPAYRSPRAVLRELARSPMRLALARGKPAAADVTASGVAALVTGHIALRHDGDRRAAAGAAVARVARALGAGRRAGWPRAERQAFERLCLVVNLIPDLERWPVRDRHRLVDVLRARGGRTEARYVRLLAGHARLARSLAALVARGDLHPPERSGSG